MIPKFKLNNGIEIPSIGLGTFELGDDKETQRTVETALSVGYRHLDTAMYYENEEAIGRAVRASGIPREEIVVTTKMWNNYQREGRVIEAFETSLKKLDIDYIDLYLIHWPVNGKIQETWKIFEEIYKTGKVRAIGVSNFKAHHLQSLKEVSDLIPAVNQIELHPYLIQQADFNYCTKEGIRVEAWSPLTSKQTNLLNEKVLSNIAGKYGKTPAQIVLRWNYQRGVIAIPKSTNEKRMKENVDIFDFNLTEDDMQAVYSLNKNKRTSADPDYVDF